MAITMSNSQNSPNFKSITHLKGDKKAVTKYTERLNKINLHASKNDDTILLDGEHAAEFLKSKYDINLPDGIVKAKTLKEVEKFGQKNPDIVAKVGEELQKPFENLEKYISNVFEYAEQKEKAGEKIKHIDLKS